MSNSTYIDNFLQSCRLGKGKVYVLVGIPSNGYYISLVLLCIINILLALSTIILNGITILVYWSASHLNKKTSYFLIMLLSLVDLGVGLLCNTTFVIWTVMEMSPRGTCFIRFLSTKLSYALAGSSFSILFLLNVERYMAIVHPIIHRNAVTNTKVLVAVVIMLLFNLLRIPVTWSLERSLESTLTTIVIVVSLITLVFMNGKIFQTGRKSLVTSAMTSNEMRQRRRLRTMKLAKSTLIATGCYLTCCIPFAVTDPLLAKNQTYFLYISYTWSVTFFFASSLVNSVVFFWRSSILRNEAKKVLLQIF